MAIMFGSGEPIARLRRGLDIKGRVVLGLDETIVPVITVSDATQPPVRRSPVRFWLSANVPAVVGEQGRFRIFHQLPTDQLVDRIWITPGTTARVFVIGHGADGAVGGFAARTTEIVDFPTTGAISRAVGIFSIADAVAVATITQPLMRLRVANVAAVIPVEIVIPTANPALAINASPALTIEGATQNDAFDVTVSGLMYDSLPITFRT